MSSFTSLRQQLLAWLIALLTTVAVCAGAAAYWLDRLEVGESLDVQLKQIAWNVGSSLSAQPRRTPDEADADPEDELIVTVWEGSGLRHASNPVPALPKPTGSGFQNVRAGAEEWRTYAVTGPDGAVQVAQRMIVRQELAANSALRAMIPFAVLIPLSWLLIGWVVNRVLRPLQAITEELRSWENGGGSLTLDQVPDEVLPLARATNDLVSKLQAQLELRRAFISNAAHEMRTPLTALRLQARNLQSSIAGADQRALLEEMGGGMRRLSGIVSQLLQLARAEDVTVGRDIKRIRLAQAIAASIQRVLPVALNRGIELGASSGMEGEVVGDPGDLQILLGNLLDNAVRYTPPGGCVDVNSILVGGRPVIEVCDTGPGIPEHLLERVFERFFRFSASNVQGSGLGLSLVLATADRLGATVSLRNRQDRTGLLARVFFPPVPPALSRG